MWFFPSSASSSTQTPHLSLCSLALAVPELGLCCAFPFHPVPVHSGNLLQLQAQISGSEWRLTGKFTFSGKLFGMDTSPRKKPCKPCLFHGLEIESWSGNGLKFRIVISPVLLLSINTFNCWGFIWISQILLGILVSINLFWITSWEGTCPDVLCLITEWS